MSLSLPLVLQSYDIEQLNGCVKRTQYLIYTTNTMSQPFNMLLMLLANWVITGIKT